MYVCTYVNIYIYIHTYIHIGNKIGDEGSRHVARYSVYLVYWYKSTNTDT